MFLYCYESDNLTCGKDLTFCGACRVEGSHLQHFCSGKSHLLCIEFFFEDEGFTISVLFKYEQVHDI